MDTRTTEKMFYVGLSLFILGMFVLLDERYVYQKSYEAGKEYQGSAWSEEAHKLQEECAKNCVHLCGDKGCDVSDNKIMK